MNKVHKKLSLSKRIENYLRKQGTWIHGGELERLAMNVGYKASNCGRRCRELHEAGTLERKEEKGHVWYKYKPQEHTIMAPVFLENGTVRLVAKVITK